MNLSDDIQVLYTFHSKFTIYADNEHLPVEKKFNMSIIQSFYEKITMVSFCRVMLCINVAYAVIWCLSVNHVRVFC